MNPNRMANHRRGEKAKLLSAVAELCVRLNRPICSGDLRDFFRDHPDRRPSLLKRLGQQLIVAAEAQDGVVPYLKQIGVFRYKAYYALEDTPAWRYRFSDYCAEERISDLLKLDIPDHIITLSSSGLEDLARHAAAGWIAELDCLAKAHSHPRNATSAARSDIELVRSYVQTPFAPSNARPLIGRDEATRFLINEVSGRRHEEGPFSSFRYLARFRWPQSALFPKIDKYRAWPEQLLHFARGKWPIADEDEEMHRAIAKCLRYGKPAHGENLCSLL
jgi:hypothetical protein